VSVERSQSMCSSRKLSHTHAHTRTLTRMRASHTNIAAKVEMHTHLCNVWRWSVSDCVKKCSQTAVNGVVRVEAAKAPGWLSCCRR